MAPRESICAVTSSAAWERPCRHILGSQTGPLPKPLLQKVMLGISREWRWGGEGMCGWLETAPPLGGRSLPAWRRRWSPAQAILQPFNPTSSSILPCCDPLAEGATGTRARRRVVPKGGIALQPSRFEKSNPPSRKGGAGQKPARGMAGSTCQGMDIGRGTWDTKPKDPSSQQALWDAGMADHVY